MIPATFVALDRLPLTPHGKLDRGALPEPPRPPEPDSAGAGPDDLAGPVAAIFREVLRVDHIAPDQSLFGLGGHSMTITQIAWRVRERLGVGLPLDVYYEFPTVAGVVGAIRSAHHR
jgi:acyl carrier protein